jgi:hypothetical protein
VTLLDVVEHFPPPELRGRLRSILDACGDSLEVVAVKVPVAGFLYGTAALLCRAGFSGNLRQLYQADTWPPHFNYFSAASAEQLLTSAGLQLLERVGDPDFEPDAFGPRIGAVSPAMRMLARVGGAALAAAVRISGRYDSVVLLARPSRA